MSNTDEEIEEKRALYFEKGAQEFWVCDQDGKIEYSDHSGKIAQSVLFPNFPQEIDLDA